MDVRPIDANALAKKACAYPDFMAMIGKAPTLSINTLRDEIYADAVAHGLWEGKELLCNQTDIVVDEVMEMLNASSRVILANGREVKRAKEHFNEELADIVIACFSLAGKLGIDIDAAVRRKMEINKGRAWKHGKE